MTMQRRDFLKAAIAGGFLLSGLAPAFAASQSPAHIVIVGGGIGGATAAKYLRMADQNITITLIEPNAQYVTCPRSNDVIVDIHRIEEITFDYAYLQNDFRVKVLQDRVIGVDGGQKTVRTAKGETLRYDRLLISPGISFDYSDIEGYSENLANTRFPHAWKAGSQTLLLKKQLKALPQGGTVAIVSPPNPFRCPPGPYERASMIAEWCQQHNPRAKILILDAKDRFVKQDQFIKGWERLYGYGSDNSLIEWIPGSEGGRVLALDAKNKRLETDWDDIQADLINPIPKQRAATLVQDLGLTDASGWCPVNPHSFESQLIPGIHIIGDAAIAGAMPKSGYAANTQAKVAAQAMLDILHERPLAVPAFANTCYSAVGKKYGVSVSAVYQVRDGAIQTVPNSGGLSPIDDNATRPILEAVYQRNWHRTFVKDVFS